MKPGKIYNEQLKNHLLGGEAFMPVEEMLKLIPFEQLGSRPNDLPYSFFEIFYHMWYTQKDILEYCMNPDYSAPKWPEDYWSKSKTPKDPEAWNDLKKAFFEDREKLGNLIASAENELSAPVPSNREHTLFREVMLVIEHSAYHAGQLLIILRLLGLK